MNLQKFALATFTMSGFWITTLAIRLLLTTPAQEYVPFAMILVAGTIGFIVALVGCYFIVRDILESGGK